MNIAARHSRLALKLALAALCMLGFAYALVPLYRVVCVWTGYNGTTGGRWDATAAQAQRIATNRLVTVEFVANTAAGLPWEFQPELRRVQAHPGDLVLAHFRVRNLGPETLVGQAVPSVTPGLAAPHLQKIECFCFSRQPLAPGEERSLPVLFVVDRELPAELSTLTLSYTFFNLPATAATGREGA